MDYNRLTRKKKKLYCPYCGSSNVHPTGRPTSDGWDWGCVDCSCVSNLGYSYDLEGAVVGTQLYLKRITNG